MPREMKDSGIEWIGKIPISWTVASLKYLLTEESDNIKVGPFGSQLSGNDFVDEGYWVYNQRSVIDNNFDNNDTYISKEKYDLMKGFQVRKDDILITTRGTIGRICRVPLNYHHGIIHPCIIKFRVDENKMLYLLLELIFNHSDIVKTQLSYKSNVTTIDVIYGETLKNIVLPLQPLNEQKKIVDFLVKKCAEIDVLSLDIKSQIRILEDYKKSVITETVTKGLNPDAKTKDSGGWIGNIPQKWKICKVKYVASYITDGAHITPDTSEETYKFLSVADMDEFGELNLENCLQITEEQYNYFVKTGCKPQLNDVIISKDGTVGKVTVVKTIEDFVIASSLVLIKPQQELLIPDYLKYCLMSEYVQEQLHSLLAGSALKRVSVNKNANLKIVFTSKLNEQKEIVMFLDKKCEEINAAIYDKRQQLDVLEQYKKSLIYEYVTGKKEVHSNG